MNRIALIHQIKTKKSCLCVGLDSDIEKIPQHLLLGPDPVFEFNKSIIDATRECCVAYKLNTAFYESNGATGWVSLQKTIDYIGKEHFIIADAKRGDIGNTSHQYAKAFFTTLNTDAVTVAPYMGQDSVAPFLTYEGKWAIVLGLTSNEGAKDFELLDCNNEKLYETVLKTVASWGTVENTMFVIGATQVEEFDRIRQILPNHFFLIPGVGTQGGSIEAIAGHALNADVGVLINISRAIIFADHSQDFATIAGQKAKEYRQEMERHIPF